LREFLKSAKAAFGGAKRKRNSTDLAAGSESVLREFLKSAKAAFGGAKRKRNSTDLAAGSESVLREFLKDQRLACVMRAANLTLQTFGTRPDYPVFLGRLLLRLAGCSARAGFRGGGAGGTCETRSADLTSVKLRLSASMMSTTLPAFGVSTGVISL
jgi:hypothetical protein